MPESDEIMRNWPSTLLESYDALFLPDLHDFVVSQEKLAAEVRKQNKELKLQNSAIVGLSSEIKGLEKQTNVSDIEKSLMLAMDSLLHLLNALEHSKSKIMQIIPKPSVFSFLWTSKEYMQLERTLNGYVKGVAFVRQKLLTSLCDMQIELICPRAKDLFDSNLHRAVEKVCGQKPGTIAKVIRYGYKNAERILRFADVTVYC